MQEPGRDTVPPAAAPREHVLVADDDAASLLLIKSLLKKEGYRVTAATDGREAVQMFEAHQPDFVLLDATMPVMDGFAAAGRIKQAAGDRFVPIMFLTALADEAALARCLEAGGDDFLTKPYSKVILQAKMRSLARMRELQNTLRRQRDQLMGHRDRNLEEQELAGEIFSRILKRWPRDLDNIRYLMRPSSLLNGDLILIGRSPDGRINIMLGDFTGHGLSAAVGTIPAADLFYEMTARGYVLADIATALNARLHELLPAHLFCAAALLSIDREHARVGVWNAGLPDVLVVGGGEQRILHRCPSRALPLGIVRSGDPPEIAQLDLREGDRIYVCSDGLIELTEGDGRLGQEGFEQLLLGHEGDLFEHLGHRVEALAAAGGPLDDVALLEIRCAPVKPGEQHRPAARAMAAARWRVVLEMGPDVLRQADPLPPLLGLIEGLQGLGEHRVRIYAVIGELFNNALDHGVLGLDSRLKHDEEGFGRYYEIRGERLLSLGEGHIEIELYHEPALGGGRLVIRITDSGGGFDFRAELAAASGVSGRPCGRGLKLAAEFCESLTFTEPGNRVEAVYRWSEPAVGAA